MSDDLVNALAKAFDEWMEAEQVAGRIWTEATVRTHETAWAMPTWRVATPPVQILFVTPNGLGRVLLLLQGIHGGWRLVDKTEPLYKRAVRWAKKRNRKRRGGPRLDPHGRHRILIANDSPWLVTGAWYLPVSHMPAEDDR